VKPRTAAVLILNRLNNNLQNCDREIDRIARQENFSHSDRQLLHNIIKGVIQNLSYIDFLISLTYKKNIKKLERAVLNLMRVGIYQAMLLKIPSYAAVFETVEAAKEICNLEVAKLINAVLRNLPDRTQIERELSRLPEIKRLSVEYSHPEWLTTKWIQQFGKEEAIELLRFNNSVYHPTFRHNPAVISWEKLKEMLLEQDLNIKETHLNGFHFFHTDNPARLLKSNIFKNRFCSVQDLSQALPVFLLNPAENETVLDCCAGPGGKTTLIAQLVRNIKVYANDISLRRLTLLKNELKLLKLKNVELLKLDAAKSRFPRIDKVLIDAPCTATGTIVKNVDIRWNRTPVDLKNLPELQISILENMAQHLKNSGIIVYCTCSLEHEENWAVVDRFLQKHKELKVEPAWNLIDKKYCDERGAIFIIPHRHKMTGSFAVRLIKYNGQK